MTIAKDRPIKMSGLKALYDRFGGELANYFIYYYLVVPEHLYGHKVQKFVNSDGDDAKIIPDWIKDRVFQYVLKNRHVFWFSIFVYLLWSYLFFVNSKSF